MGNLPPFTPLPLMSTPTRSAASKSVAKPKAPSKPAVSTVETILGKSPLPLMRPAAKPKTLTRTNVVSVAGPGGASGYTNTPTQQASKQSAGSRVVNLQKQLVAKGYVLNVDGIQGPLTTAAANDARLGGNPTAWNEAHSGHGVVAAAAAQTAADTAPAAAAKAAPVKSATPAPPRAPAAAAVPAAPQGSVEEQAKAIVDSILNPLIDNVRSTENQRAAAGQKMISGYTGDAIDKLNGIDVQAPYTAAAGGANAVNDAALALLQGKGSDLAAGVGAKLAAAGQDASGVVGGINADTAGAAGAGYAKGGATVASLLGEGASAGAYGKKLPGIEALAGQQNSGLLQGQVNTDTAKQLSDITATAPQLIQSTLANLHTENSQDKALKINAILASGYDPTTGTLTPDAQKALAGIVGTDPSALAGGSASTANAAARAAATTAKINPGVSKILGYAATADGSPIVTKDGKIVPVDKTGAKGQPKAPTSAQLSKMIDGFFEGKPTTQHTPVLNADKSPVTDANGAPVYRTTDGPKSGQLDYGQAYKRLLALNVTDMQARQLLDTRYARGDRGRAWLTNEEQAALKNAGLAPKATRYKSVAYLTKDQVTALQQAHKLPAGQWAGNHYVIDQGF